MGFFLAPDPVTFTEHKECDLSLVTRRHKARTDCPSTDEFDWRLAVRRIFGQLECRFHLKMQIPLLVLALVGAYAAHAEDGSKRTLETICTLTSSLYVDAAMNGLDWGALCSRAEQRLESGTPLTVAANELLAELEVSHTRYFAPSDPALAILAAVYREAPNLKDALAQDDSMPLLRGAGFTTFDVGGSRFVDSILDGSPAQVAGLRIGDEIIDDGGAAFRAVLPTDPTAKAFETEIVIRRQESAAQQTLVTQVVSANALAVLSDATENSLRIVEHRGRRIGYMRGWTMLSRDDFGGPRIVLEHAISDGRLAEIDALVFDARGLVGGGGMDVLDRFFAPSNLSLSFMPRGSDWVEAPSMPDDTPLVIIIGDQTRSAAEIMAYIAKEHDLATLVGQKTAGAVVGGRLELLQNGGGLYIAVGRLRIEGAELEGVGVLPDIETDRVQPFGNGIDPAYERALDLAAEI